jgi:hypothetical protein
MPKSKSIAVPDSVIQAEKAAPDLGISRLEMAAQILSLESETDYRNAGEMLTRVATSRNNWSAYWEGVIRPLKTAYDAARGKRDEVAKRLDSIRSTLESKMSIFRTQQDLLHREANARLEDAAEALRGSLMNEAKGLLIAGRRDEAVATMEQADAVIAPRIEVERSKLDGVAAVQDYDVEITDLMALVIAVAKGEVPLYGAVNGKRVALLEARESLIKDRRKSMGEAFRMPGVKVTPKTRYQVRTEE